MAAVECIREEDLRALIVGALPKRLEQLVTEHLEVCPACEARARRLDEATDPFLHSLRQAVGPGATSTETGSGPAAGPAAPAPMPRRIAGYEVLEELGRGGMSVVYKARQARPRRLVALKMILAGAHASAERRARFFAEAEAIARLRHPNIVQIYEAGEQDGLPFLALELVTGGTLAQRLGGRPLSPQSSAALVETLAQAVHHAHVQGVVHRDLKPANILLQRNRSADYADYADKKAWRSSSSLESGESVDEFFPKITDFGLAKLERPELTATGAVLGTPSYMAPEQAAGENLAVGPAADIHALGAILYDLLTGRPPFQGATMLETLEQVRAQEPVAPSRLQGKVPRDLSTICLKCLQKEPRKRYARAQDLADDLRRFLEGKPIQARAVGSIERVWRWSRRNPAWAALLASVASLLLVIAVGASLMTLRLNQALTVSEEERGRVLEAQQATKYRLWEAYLAEAHSHAISGRRGQRFRGLEAIRKALELPVPPERSTAELRTEAIACLSLTDIESSREPEGYPGDVTAVVLDHRNGRYACVEATAAVRIRRLADGAEVMRLPGFGRFSAWGVAFSPDGRFLHQRCAPGNQVKVWKVDGPEPVLAFEIREETVHESVPAFRPDSGQLAVGHADGSIGIYDTSTGQRVRHFRPDLVPELLAFHPSRPCLAVAGGKRVRVLDGDSGRVLADLPPHPEDLNWIDWHPRGDLLATACGDTKIRLWDTGRARLVLPPLEGHTAPPYWLRFSGAGDRLFSCDWHSSRRVWDVRTGRQLLATVSESWFLTPEDKVLTFGSSDARFSVLRFAAGRELRAWALSDSSPRRRFMRAQPSPDGRYLVVEALDSLVFVDWASGTEVASVPSPRTLFVAFEPSGALLTNGPDGLFRWPVWTGTEPDVLGFGPPQSLHERGSVNLYGSSADAGVLAIPSYQLGAVVIRRPDQHLTVGPRNDVRYCAVSPDGRWVVTGNHWQSGGSAATVWDAVSGRLVKDLPVDTGLCLVGFSPDGRWLVTTGGGYRLWKAGSWQEGPRIAGPGESGRFAFSRDSQTLALTGGLCQVRLIQPDSGAEIARLTVPEQTSLYPQCFSPDGAQLVALGAENGLLYVWDLRAIRAGLKELGLDWDRPDYPPPPPPLGAGPALGAGLPTPPPVRIEIDPGPLSIAKQSVASLAQYGVASGLQPLSPEAHYRRGVALAVLERYAEAVEAASLALFLQPDHAGAYRLRGRAYRELGQLQASLDDLDSAIRVEPGEIDGYLERAQTHLRRKEFGRAVADLRKPIDREPSNPLWLNRLGWLLANGPEPLRDPAGAVALAEKAVALEPSMLHRNTLGVAYYRAGRFPEARRCLEENLKFPASPQIAGYSWFFLAMCHQRQGETDQARDCFQRAANWRKVQPPPTRDWPLELDAIQAEAEDVLRQPVP